MHDDLRSRRGRHAALSEQPVDELGRAVKPSCAGAYGDDCKTKDYLHGFTEYCLPHCVNVQ